MSLLAQIKSLVAPSHGDGKPRIAVFGDSHCAALQRAHEFADRNHEYSHIRITRLRKEKNGKQIGDSDLAAFCRQISRLDASDYVFSAVGGNQYAVVSTVRSPIEYDFFASPADDRLASDRVQLVPFRAIAGYIEDGVRGTIGPVLREIRNATSARVFHLCPPPPKADNTFIVSHFEGRFAHEGIQDLGPTDPELRLKCWQVQSNVLERLCQEVGARLVLPPAKALTADGYLQPRCYAKDVTHANRRYGEYVLRQILKLTSARTAQGARR